MQIDMYVCGTLNRLLSYFIANNININIVSYDAGNVSSPCFASLLGPWCLSPLSTLVPLYRSGQFYWWRKPQYP